MGGSLSWHLWQERNRRWSQERRPQEEVTKGAIKDAILSFGIKAQPPDPSSIESRALESWKSVYVNKTNVEILEVLRNYLFVFPYSGQ